MESYQYIMELMKRANVYGDVIVCKRDLLHLAKLVHDEKKE